MEKKGKQLIYKGIKLISGMPLIGTIEGSAVEGKLYINEKCNDYYFCQNIKDGSNSPDKLGYVFSWIFSPMTSKGNIVERFGSQVELNFDNILELNGVKFNHVMSKTIGDEQRPTALSVNIEKGKWNVKSNDKDIITDISRDIKNYTPLFNQINHPDCCGSILLYNFCQGSHAEYGRYNGLTEKEYELIEIYLNSTKAAKIVHLAEFQIPAKQFVEKLGFKSQFQYKNNNSDKIISVYHFNPEE